MIPSSDVLWGSFTVPDVSSAALDGAVTEALWRASPLPLDQVAVAWRAQPNDPGGWQVTWGVCPSHQVSQGLAQLQLPEGAPVYLADEGGTALLIRGSVWDGHRRAQRRLDMLAAGGVALVTVALLAPMAMPLVLKRQAVVRAMAHMETVEPMASPVRKKLDELHGLSKLAEGLVAERQDSLPLASALDRLAEALPSDAWLDRLEASDRQVRIMGLTPNATELMGRLNRVAEFSELRSTAPTVRDEGQNRERFSVEFSWRDASSGAVGK